MELSICVLLTRILATASPMPILRRYMKTFTTRLHAVHINTNIFIIFSLKDESGKMHLGLKVCHPTKRRFVSWTYQQTYPLNLQFKLTSVNVYAMNRN